LKKFYKKPKKRRGNRGVFSFWLSIFTEGRFFMFFVFLYDIFLLQEVKE